MDNDLFDYIVSLLVRNANDSIEECRESKHDSFEEGRKQAYYEVLDTIKINSLLLSITSRIVDLTSIWKKNIFRIKLFPIMGLETQLNW